MPRQTKGPRISTNDAKRPVALVKGFPSSQSVAWESIEEVDLSIFVVDVSLVHRCNPVWLARLIVFGLGLNGMRHGLCKDMLPPTALCESRTGSASDCRRMRVTAEVGMLPVGA
jgi:hypothetical protein